MKMEIVALTRALGCIAANQPKSRHLVFVTDPQSRPTIRKVKPNNMLRSEQIKAIHRIRLRSVVWIFCPGHAGVRGNEAADKLAGEATVGDDIKPDRADLIDRVARQLRDQELEEAEAHYAIARMQEMGLARGMGRKLRLAGKERKMYNQMQTGTVSMDTLRMALVRGTEHLWTCPQCNDVVAPTKV